MGSKLIWELKAREGFVFIGKTQDTVVHEKRAALEHERVSVVQIFKLNQQH